MNMYYDYNYWNMYYEGQEDNYEWYNSWSEISKNIPLKIKEDSEVLHIGCGFSTLGDELYNSGVKSVINADFSEICIMKMKSKYPHLKYLLLDALEISDKFQGDYFDLIIDKGCLDSILCDENSLDKVQRVLLSFHTTLKTNGSLIVVSVGNPAERLMYFKPEMWNVEVVKMEKQGIDVLSNFENEDGGEIIPDLGYHYVYFCWKRLTE